MCVHEFVKTLHHQDISKVSQVQGLDHNLELIVSIKNKTQYRLEYPNGKRSKLLGSFLTSPMESIPKCGVHNCDFGKLARDLDKVGGT